MRELGPGRAAAALVAALLSPAAVQAAGEAPLIVHAVTFERAEYRLAEEGDLVAWEGYGFVGTDEWKLRLENEAEWQVGGGGFETLETQLVVQHPLGDFFDLEAGLRYDAPAGPNRLYGVLGIAGLAQQWVEVDAALFVSQTGDLSARLDLEYELLVTNRIVLTPAAEIDFALAEDEEIGVGRGLSKTELGLRLSYDLLYRDLAPYVGLHWERSWGRSAALARDEGEDAGALSALAGVRLRF